METVDKAIMAFSQSEKVKTGIIWASQSLSLLHGLPGAERKGAERIVTTLINMIIQEVKLAEVVSGDDRWKGIASQIEKSIMMIDSGVGEEAVNHLSRALSFVTNIGQQSMLLLRDKGLL
ncbi:MAG: hypothetical protein JW932_17035 [Deltaproteobacteria bacterium]|nr:hypothetical protein [Deltaproteobacteria bacterium]